MAIASHVTRSYLVAIRPAPPLPSDRIRTNITLQLYRQRTRTHTHTLRIIYTLWCCVRHARVLIERRFNLLFSNVFDIPVHSAVRSHGEVRNLWRVRFARNRTQLLSLSLNYEYIAM